MRRTVRTLPARDLSLPILLLLVVLLLALTPVAQAQLLPPAPDWCEILDFRLTTYSAIFAQEIPFPGVQTWLLGHGITNDPDYAAGAFPVDLVPFRITNAYTVHPAVVQFNFRAANLSHDDIVLNLGSLENIFGITAIPDTETHISPSDQTASITVFPNSSTDASNILSTEFGAFLDKVFLETMVVEGYGSDPFLPTSLSGESAIPCSTATATPTHTPSITNTPTPYMSPTPSLTPNPSDSPTPTATDTATPVPGEVCEHVDFDGHDELEWHYQTIGFGQGDGSIISDGYEGNGWQSGTPGFDSGSGKYVSGGVLDVHVGNLVNITSISYWIRPVGDDSPTYGGGQGGLLYGAAWPGDVSTLGTTDVGWPPVGWSQVVFSGAGFWDGRDQFGIYAYIPSDGPYMIQVDNIEVCHTEYVNSPTPSPTNPTATFSATSSPTSTQTPTRTLIPPTLFTPPPAGSPAPTFTLPPLGTLPPPASTRTLIPSATPYLSPTPNLTATSTPPPDDGGGPPIECQGPVILGLNFCILQTIVDFFNWLINTVLNFLDWLLSLIRWLIATVSNLFQFLINFLQGLLSLIQWVIGLINQLLSIIGLILQILVQAFDLFVGWLFQLVNLVRGLLGSFTSAPLLPVPGLWNCVSAPMLSDVCATFYLVQYTIFGGTLGTAIQFVLLTIIDLNTVVYIVVTVRNLIRQAKEVAKS